MGTMDGVLVRLLYDLEVEGEVLVGAGTVFFWSDASTHQCIDGQLVFVDEDEVEAV